MLVLNMDQVHAVLDKSVKVLPAYEWLLDAEAAP